MTPDMSALVYCLSEVLLQSCTCWWDQLDIAFLCKLCETCLVDIGCGSCSVIKQYDEPLSGVRGIFINMTGAVARRLSVWISSDRAESTLPTLTSFHVWPSRRPCRSPSKHETSVVPELSQGPVQFSS